MRMQCIQNLNKNKLRYIFKNAALLDLNAFMHYNRDLEIAKM